MPSYGTLGALIDDGYTVSAYCACRTGTRLLAVRAPEDARGGASSRVRTHKVFGIAGSV